MARVRQGGFIQQMRRQEEERQVQQAVRGEPRVGSSKLAMQLLMKWAWGTMSLPTIQMLAAAAVKDGLSQPLLRWVCTNENGFSGVREEHLAAPTPNLPCNGAPPPPDQPHTKTNPNQPPQPPPPPTHTTKCNTVNSTNPRRIARIGAQGRLPNHMHRDILRTD